MVAMATMTVTTPKTLVSAVLEKIVSMKHNILFIDKICTWYKINLSCFFIYFSWWSNGRSFGWWNYSIRRTCWGQSWRSMGNRLWRRIRRQRSTCYLQNVRLQWVRSFKDINQYVSTTRIGNKKRLIPLVQYQWILRFSFILEGITMYKISQLEIVKSNI